jgi:hypothetical protein
MGYGSLFGIKFNIMAARQARLAFSFYMLFRKLKPHSVLDVQVGV